MTFITNNLLPVLLLYKYWGLFGLTFLSSFIIPIPPGTLIMASAAFSDQGYFDFYLVILVSVLGNVLGDNLNYFISRKYGHKILLKLGFKKILASEKYKKFEKKLKEKAGFIIFLSRFEVSANLIVNIISGTTKINHKKYLLYSSIGEVSQVLLYGFIGYYFGNNWEILSSIFGRSLLIIVVILIFIYILKLNKK